MSLHSHDIPEALQPHRAHPVAVLGAGVSGQAARALLERFGFTVTLYDERTGQDAGARSRFEPADHSLAVVSPGFGGDHPWLRQAGAARLARLGELDLGALFWAGPLIAITGTNGKSTLTSFLTQALKRAGRPSVACGNIGRPLSRICLEEPHSALTAVCEVSSFQAERLRHLRIDALIWSNFAEDHLDRYPDMGAYFDAKANLFACRKASSTPIILGDSVRRQAKALGRSLPEGTWSPVSLKALNMDGTPFALGPQRENLALAAALWKAFDLPEAQLYQAARGFVLPRHRLQVAGEAFGIRFWNDSKATNFASALAAVDALERPVYWVGGGRAKGGDLTAFAASLARKITAAFVTGEVGEVLRSALEAAGTPVTVCADIDTATLSAGAAARRAGGGSVLLSPGFSSLDQFRDYGQRGLVFERAVRSFFRENHEPESVNA
ncbi:MAG: UDP-N-acetylmuramoyl-L-alanine--D-glutamate ligase [Opitutales bacterium]